MKRILHIADDFVLARVKRITDAIQRFTGVDCLRLGRECELMGTAVAIVICLFHKNWFYLCLCSLSFMMIAIGTALGLAREEDDSIRREVSSGFLNSRRTSWFDRRLWLSSFAALSSLSIWTGQCEYSVAIGAQLLCAVFGACEPLSPSESKIRQWVNGIRASLSRMQPVESSAQCAGVPR